MQRLNVNKQAQLRVGALGIFQNQRDFPCMHVRIMSAGTRAELHRMVESIVTSCQGQMEGTVLH